MLRIFTDGSCKKNGRKGSVGGWGFAIIEDNDQIWLENSGSEVDTTNNKMEMIAIIKALEFIDIDNEETVEIYTDSAYVHNCIKEKWYKKWIENGWKTSSNKPVKNQDLWLSLIPYFENEKFVFKKVKGHAGDKWNEYVDDLAQFTAQRLKEEVDN